MKANESGVDESVSKKFPGAEVTYGSAASGAGDGREIPLSEGGDINPSTGRCVFLIRSLQRIPILHCTPYADPCYRAYKAGDYEGLGGPEDKARVYAQEQGGNDDVRSNIRQGGETVRPAGSMSNDAQGGTGKRTQ